jgi:glycerate kinase
VLELAEASGLRRLPGGEHAPLTAGTYGTGQLLRAALDAGARRVVLGVGGSASTDGGAGMACALGVRLLDARGQDLAPGGAALLHLHAVDVSGLARELADASVVLASDVDNPLLGERGAAAVYGPQKGASPRDVERLEAALTRYALVLRRDLGVDVARVPGAGAAGGAGAGALAFLSARIASGIDLLLDVVRFPQALQGADLVVTGEGSFDAQSLHGKAPVGVAQAARAAGVPVVALVGRLDVSADQLRSVGIHAAHALMDLAPDEATAVRTPRGCWPGWRRAPAGPSRRSAEADLAGRDGARRPAGRRLVGPVEVGVRDDVTRCGRAPLRLVLGRVGVADQHRVVAAHQGAVQRRPDARVGLRPGHQQPPDLEAGQHLLEPGVLEGVAVGLLDRRLARVRRQLRDDPPAVAAVRQLVVGVLHPHHRHVLGPRPVDQLADPPHDRVALVRGRHDVVLHVDDEQGRARAVDQGRHAGTQAQRLIRVKVGRAQDGSGRRPAAHGKQAVTGRPGRA